MTPETLHPCAHRIALTYPFTEHCWPFGPEYDMFNEHARAELIDDSWHQVVNKLSKKAQQRLRPR